MPKRPYIPTFEGREETSMVNIVHDVVEEA
jgi:hypothetical protein